jgi:23S rRNA (uracil1939-C5)-methyltransferase
MKPHRQKQANKFLELSIERIVPDGYGIGFAEGLTVFVSLAAVGDRLRVKVDREKGKVAFANIVEILEPSPDRIEPPCPYFGRCGGCDFQQLNYAAQLRAKVGIVRDALRRIGKIDWQEEIEIVPSPREWNYRTRVQWKRDGKKLGYFERNSHHVQDVEICPIIAPSLQKELAGWREKIKTEYVNFGEIQAVSADEQVSWQFNDAQSNFDENFYAANKDAEKEEIRLDEFDNAASEISLKINEFTYKFSASGFFQVNHEILPQVLERALQNAQGNLALDLYCGVGLFSLPLAKRFAQVAGIEGNRASVEFAAENAAQAELSNIKFETAWVGDWLAKNAEELPEVDLILLDPPRTGSERETINRLIELKPKQIVYVSCNPTTLARDLKLLVESNVFVIENITAFDFFPQTHHVETVVKLRRVKM